MTSNFHEFSNDPLIKFELMLKTDDVYFFDAEDFEEIIHHYLNNGKVSLAKKGIKIGLKQHPSSTELELLRIEVLVFEDKLEKAEQLLNKLQKLEPNNEEIFIQRANIYSKQDNHEAAVEFLGKALAIGEEPTEIYGLIGMEHIFLDNFELAKNNFIKCIEADIDDYRSLYNIIFCFQSLEDHDGAIVYLNNYINSNPYSEVAWHQLGKQYATKGMNHEALSAFEYAIISDELFLGAYIEKGKILEKLGRYKEAIENYEITIKLDDPTSFIYLRIGNCHENIGNSDLAKHYYFKTVQEDPLLDKAWVAITKFYYNQENYEKALEYSTKALNIDAENALYWEQSGYIHKKLKNFDKAEHAFETAVQFGIYNMNIWIAWFKILKFNGKATDAFDAILQAKEFFPDEAEVEYNLAGTYFEIDNIFDGRIHLEKALALDFSKKNIIETDYQLSIYNSIIKTIISKFDPSNS